MSEQEIAKKSKHLAELKAQIEHYESKVSTIEDWVHSKEEEVNKLTSKKNDILEKLIADRRDLEAKEKSVKDQLHNLELQKNRISELSRDLDLKRENIASIETRIIESGKHSNLRESIVTEREQAVAKREAFIKSIFEGMDNLKNGR